MTLLQSFVYFTCKISCSWSRAGPPAARTAPSAAASGSGNIYYQYIFINTFMNIFINIDLYFSLLTWWTLALRSLVLHRLLGLVSEPAWPGPETRRDPGMGAWNMTLWHYDKWSRDLIWPGSLKYDIMTLWHVTLRLNMTWGPGIWHYDIWPRDSICCHWCHYLCVLLVHPGRVARMSTIPQDAVLLPHSECLVNCY